MLDNNIFQSIFDSQDKIIVFSLDKEYRYTSFSKAHKYVMKQIWGVDIKLGVKMLDSIKKEDDMQKAKKNFDRALSGESFVLTEEYGDEELLRVFYDDYYAPVRDKQNNIIGLSVFVIDVTERTQIANKLERQNQEYASVNEELRQTNEELLVSKEKVEKNEKALKEAQKIAKIGSWELDIVDDKLFWSDEIYRIFGVEPQSFNATYDTFLSYIYPDDRDRVNKAYLSHLDEKKSYNIIHRILVNGKIKYVNERCNTIFDKKDNPIRSLGTIADITEQVLIQQELTKIKNEVEKTQLMLEHVISNSSSTIWKMSLDANGDFYDVFMSNVIDKFLRLPEGSINNNYDKFISYVLPEYLPCIEETFEDGFKNVGKYVSCDYQIKRADGSLAWFLTKGQAVLENGKLVAYGSTSDITERKNIEKSLTESERKFRSIFENVPLGIFHYDKNGVIISCNQNFVKIIGSSKEVLLGLDMLNLKDQKLIEALKLSLQGQKGVYEGDYQSITANKTTPIKVYFEPFISENNEVIGGIGVVEDITERKSAQEDLKRQNEKLKHLNDELISAKELAEKNEYKIRYMFESTLTGFIYLDTEGNILDVNEATVNIMGSPSAEATKQINVLKFKPLVDLGFAADVQKCISNKDIVINHIHYISKWKKSIYLKYFIVPVLNNGEVTNIWANFLDLTDLWKSKNELEKAKLKAEESDRLKSEFINNMSHEIRTPMNAIMGFSDLLGDENLTPENRQYYTKIIQNSSNQLLRIINDILEISKLGTKQVKVIKSEVNINDLLLELFSVFDIRAKERNLSLYLNKNLIDSKSVIYTDASKLNKILSNLLENALKFTNKGFVELGYKLIDNQVNTAEKIMQIYVKDTGIGINNEKQKIIFDRFSQEDIQVSKKVGGLGLGLAIAKENAMLIGGEITLESEKGKGSTFYVNIPYEKVDFKEEISIDEADKILVLVAEDEEVNFLFLETLLENFNEKIEVIHAKNGQEAVEICKVKRNVKLVFMDLKMPVMNGFEATKNIKQICPDLPVVAQTAYSTKEDEQKAINAGCSYFISKPINKDIITEIFEKYLK